MFSRSKYTIFISLSLFVWIVRLKIPQPTRDKFENVSLLSFVYLINSVYKINKLRCSFQVYAAQEFKLCANELYSFDRYVSLSFDYCMTTLLFDCLRISSFLFVLTVIYFVRCISDEGEIFWTVPNVLLRSYQIGFDMFFAFDTSFVLNFGLDYTNDLGLYFYTA